MVIKRQIFDDFIAFDRMGFHNFKFMSTEDELRAKEVGNILAEKDFKNADFYRENVKSYTEKLTALDGEYSGIEFLSTNGKLDKNKVYLSDIPPFGFVGFEVKI